jgi:multimeric flavodoxin WrbA
MKVLLISGTDHKGSTYSIGRILAEKLTGKENISEVFLPRDFGEFCCGCTNCFLKNETECPHYAKLRPITELIDSSDVLIFTTPTYVYHASGQMKALLDHYGWRWMVHRPEEKMFRKQAVVISTAAGKGMSSAIKDVADSCFFWGIPCVYKYGKAVMETRWSHVRPEIKRSIEAKTDSLAEKIRRRDGRTRVPFKTRGLFFIMSLLQRKGFNEADRNYWNEKGWTKGGRPWR